MPFKLKFGKPAGRERHRPRFWTLIGNFISGVFLTLGLLIILVALAEFIVYLIDLKMGNGDYLDWARSPWITILSAIPFILIHLSLRFRLISRVLGRIRSSSPPKKIETIDLD